MGVSKIMIGRRDWNKMKGHSLHTRKQLFTFQDVLWDSIELICIGNDISSA